LPAPADVDAAVVRIEATGAELLNEPADETPLAPRPRAP